LPRGVKISKKGESNLEESKDRCLDEVAEWPPDPAVVLVDDGSGHLL